jgi:hypothetical protein
LGDVVAQAAPDLRPFLARAVPTDVPGICRRPRVSFGQVVVARRATVVDSSWLPSEGDAFDHFSGLRQLVRAAGLPPVAFARAVAPERSGPAGATPFETKPLWLDLESPISPRLLRRLLKGGVRAVELCEALPRPDTEGLVVGASGRRRAAEWLLEYITDEVGP